VFQHIGPLRTLGNGFIVAPRGRVVKSGEGPGFPGPPPDPGVNLALMASFAKAFSALKALTDYETMLRPPYGRREMNLPRTRALLKALGNPERGYGILQVAGTKGKGTAATSCAAILRAAGFRTGLYTSPHLLDVRERIAVDGAWIGKGAFADAVSRMLVHVRPLEGTAKCPTFFEMMTVLALLHFREAGAQAVVLEVGLGGRLDATSAVRPLASLITQIGLDHTHILGGTKALIAREKAGVAKRGVPLVSGVPPATEAGRAIAAFAAEVGAPLLAPGPDLRVRTGAPLLTETGGRTPVEVWVKSGRVVSTVAPVLSRELARDVGLAAALLSLPRVRRRLPVTPEAMQRGIADLVLPGRMQIVSRNPILLIDGAHNPDSARALARAIRETIRPHTVHAIIGGGADKALPTVAAAVARSAPEVRLSFTRPRTHPRAADPKDLMRRFPGSRSFEDLATALAGAKAVAGSADLIVVTGSMYLAGEALEPA